jgi:hypothetical protein
MSNSVEIGVLDGGFIEVQTTRNIQMIISARHIINVHGIDENKTMISDPSAIGLKGIPVNHSYAKVLAAIVLASQKISLKVLV